MPVVTVPERLALSVRALGEAGEAWLAALPGLLADLEADWLVTVGTGLEGGNAAYVAEAVTRDGTPAVLKVPVPPGMDGFTPFEPAGPGAAGTGQRTSRRTRRARDGQIRDPTDIFTDAFTGAVPLGRSGSGARPDAGGDGPPGRPGRAGRRDGW